jgi:hypothetical protein
MEPRMTVTLSVRRHDGSPALLVKLPDGELYNIPLNETPDTIAQLVRGLAQLVAETALKEATALAETLKAGRNG